MSWLKFDTATPEKPEVFAITIAIGWEDPDTTVGKLLKVWRWFDLHSVDGNASSVTLALLDRLIGVTGLSQAMVDVGWLEVSDTGLTLPNFENHNGKTAKDRALTAKRAAGYRVNIKSNDKSNAPRVTNALPREEKRREEKIEELTPIGVKRPAKKCPDAFLVTESMKIWASTECANVDIHSETAKFRDHTFSTARTDWVATWRNWIRKNHESKPFYGKDVMGHVNKQEALEASNRAVVDRLLEKEAQYAQQ